ncbi:MAG: sulfurtransferase complex subunit TusB [Candidatus Dasytiphilus stammeri]
MLHILSHPLHSIDLEVFLRFLMHGDEIFMLQDGIIMGFKTYNILFNELSIIPVATRYALKNDVEARGVLNLMSSNINLINYDEFITLSTTHIQQIHW